MSTKKTIQINPELFKMAGNKTKKARSKKELTISPVINPNSLKNKLLKRIKEHKTQEIKTKSGVTNETNVENGDEFYGALNYLSEVTKKNKMQRAIHNKTIKQQHATPSISLELPQELQEQIPIPPPRTPDVFNVNYKVEDDVPYGCLKNGKKKTYREWKEMNNPVINELIRPPTPPKRNLGIFLEGAKPIEEKEEVPKQISTREQKLEEIKNRLRKMQDEETNAKQKTIEDFKKMEKEMTTHDVMKGLDDLDDTMTDKKDIDECIKEHNEKQKEEKEKNKVYLKKTVKKKFTLGKSDKLRKVAILVKDRQTRKNIINAQKDLKKTNITDVKKYLRQHGMIKVGSTCPADILRKTFESAMLTGEVTNTNKETLLHNFMNP